MPIYYSQIRNNASKKILTGAFSLAGAPYQRNNALLVELKNCISKIPSGNKIFSMHSESGSEMFFIKVTEALIFLAIADIRTTDSVIAEYFLEIEKAYLSDYSDHSDTHYEFDDKLKSVTNNFNKSYKMKMGIKELENTHHALVENLDTLIKRGENINVLKDLAERVNLESREMSRKVSKMKLNAQIEKYKIYGILLLCIVIILFFFFKLK